MPDRTPDQRKRDQRRQLVNNIALALVVLLVAFSSVKSSIAADKAEEARIRGEAEVKVRDAIIKCTSSILFNTVRAVNERTAPNTNQAKANIKLQSSQAIFLDVLLDDRSTESVRREALNKYFVSLREFNEAATNFVQAGNAFPYPTPRQYSDCLRAANRE